MTYKSIPYHKHHIHYKLVSLCLSSMATMPKGSLPIILLVRPTLLFTLTIMLSLELGAHSAWCWAFIAGSAQLMTTTWTEYNFVYPILLVALILGIKVLIYFIKSIFISTHGFPFPDSPSFAGVTGWQKNWLNKDIVSAYTLPRLRIP